MENESHEPLTRASALPQPARTRHDGWTGEKMATFCEALAETAVVEEACDQAGMSVSGAYAHRRRNPMFAAAWDAALTVARERLADTLLSRSMEGNRELIYQNGELVGERHVLDNRLGLAILRRLDRLAETGSTVSIRGERLAPIRHQPACNPRPIDWTQALDALRTGDEDAIGAALAMLRGDEVEEVEDPPIPFGQGDGKAMEIDLSHRCWKEDDGSWMTDFPPPPGFDGYESDDWPAYDYERDCTDEEAALLEANEKAAEQDDRAEDEQKRDLWFAMLREEVGHLAHAQSAGEASPAIPQS